MSVSQHLMTSPFSQNVIAMIWDFDKTLIPGNMQRVLFDAYGVDEDEFWREVNALPACYRERGCAQVTMELLYLNRILDYVAAGRFPDLSNERLVELGRGIEFHPGLPDFFERIKTVLETGKYRRHELQLEHYVVSTGLKKLIEGSALAAHLDGVWGCEFLESDDVPRRIARIGYVLDDTTKTRAVFEINKGVNKDARISVNDSIGHDKRRVPIAQMIYIADGPSDVPVFSVVGRERGKTLGVFSPERYDVACRLLEQDRVHAIARADYREGTDASMWLERALAQIADRVIERRDRLLETSVGRAPTHLA